MVKAQSQSLGAKIRRARLRAVMTLDELARHAAMSKAYLSLIETGRVTNPPSDEKLRRIEQTLGFPANELIGQAHLQRTPADVRIVLQQLMRQRRGALGDAREGRTARPGAAEADEGYLQGVLHELSTRPLGMVEMMPQLAGLSPGSVASTVPVIGDRVAASGDVPAFQPNTDGTHPGWQGTAYVSAPGISDPGAFAARIAGDSMSPKYAENDIVIFSPAAGWKDGADYLVRFTDGHVAFSRVYTEVDGKGGESLRMESRNNRYPTRKVGRQQVAGLYRAVFCYRNVAE